MVKEHKFKVVKIVMVATSELTSWVPFESMENIWTFLQMGNPSNWNIFPPWNQ